MTKQVLLSNIAKLHTTKLGEERICKNLSLSGNVVEYCKNAIFSEKCNIYRQGKNYYCETENVKITVNAHSFTVITAHPLKANVMRVESW